MKLLSDTDLLALVHQGRDKQNLSFLEMEKKFKEDGIVSKRTRKPMKANTIRYLYYYGRANGKTKSAAGPAASKEISKLNMVGKILGMDIDAEHKVTLIESVLKDF